MRAEEKARLWLNASNIDEESKKQIENLLNNSDELEESFQ